MNLYIRLMWVTLKSMGDTKTHVLNPVKTSFRVMPWDLDVLGHMNNGRYLQIADVARIHWTLKTNILTWVKTRGFPILGGNIIRYCRPLKPFQKYEVITQIMGWDDRWLFLEHRFQCKKGKTVAIGLTRVCMRRKGTWISPKGVFESMQPKVQCAELPPSIRAWKEADQHILHGEKQAFSPPRTLGQSQGTHLC